MISKQFKNTSKSYRRAIKRASKQRIYLFRKAKLLSNQHHYFYRK